MNASTKWLTRSSALVALACAFSVPAFAGKVTSSDIKSRPTKNSDVQDTQIQAEKIAAGTCTAAEVAADAITASGVADDGMDTAMIQDGIVLPAKIAAGTLTAGALTASGLADAAVDAATIAKGSMIGARPAVVTLTPGEPADDAVDAASIAAGAVSAATRADAVDSAKIAVGVMASTDVAADVITDAHVAADPAAGSAATFEVRHSTATCEGGLFRVKANGDVDQLGTVLSGFQTFDVAEFFPTNSVLEAGDVVVAIDDPSTPGLVARSSAPYQRAVVGVVTTNPAIILGGAFSDEVYFPELCRAEREARALGDVETAAALRDQIHIAVNGLPRVAVALAGRVPVKVSTENGRIEVGDLLTTSSTPGHAMRFVPGTKAGEGIIIGKALQSLDAGTGSILMLVSNS